MATAVYPTPFSPSMNNTTNKRKRGNEEMGRNVRSNNVSSEENDYNSLLQGLTDSAQDDNTRTAQAALAGAMDQGGYPEPGTYDAKFDPNAPMNAGFGDVSSQGMGGPPNPSMYSTPSQTPSKPAVGSADWHKTRKDMHKEVERRRREVINEGIETIAKIVPGTEKNKGAILQRTAQYIGELKDTQLNFDKERATLDITIKELTLRNERLKASVQHAWQESKKWQRRCQEAGLQFDDYDDGGLGLDTDDFDPAGVS